jgi:hypothetical protein
MKLFTIITLVFAGTAVAAPSKAIGARNPIDDSAPHIDDQNFIGRIMDAHWYWRRIHCAQDLQWDPALAQAALESVNACTNMPQHVSYFLLHANWVSTNESRIAAAATCLRVVRPLPTTMSGWSSLALSSTAGMRRRPSTHTTSLATRTPGVTSPSWSGAIALRLVVLWLTAPTTTRGLLASIVVGTLQTTCMIPS